MWWQKSGGSLRRFVPKWTKECVGSGLRPRHRNRNLDGVGFRWLLLQRVCRGQQSALALKSLRTLRTNELLRLGIYGARGQDQSELLITADGGGSNSHRSRLWKVCLQELATELEVKLHVCHFPPGTSKWNKIEHRLFSFITQNWRGKPLVSVQTIVSLIASTRPRKGLVVKAAVDENHYETNIKISDEVLGRVK
jgi:hypothetical protein